MATKKTKPRATQRDAPRKAGRPARSQPGSGFGARLRYYREESGLTLEAAAARITEAGWRVDRAALHRLETGGEPPWIAKLTALAAALGCPPLLLVTPLADEDFPGGLVAVGPPPRKRRA